MLANQVARLQTQVESLTKCDVNKHSSKVSSINFDFIITFMSLNGQFVDTGGRASTLPSFSVKMNDSQLIQQGSVYNYQVEQLNVGGAMDLKSGIFTAPTDGIYFFAFSGQAKSNTQSSYLMVSLNTNSGRNLGTAFFYAPVSLDEVSSASLQATAHLTAGEQVYLIAGFPYGTYLYDPGNYGANQFTGWLIQADSP